MIYSIDKNSLLKFFATLSLTSIFFTYLISIDSITIGLIFLLFMFLSLYFIATKKLILFEPFTLFSMYFYTVVMGSFYLYSSNFEHSIFINYQSFSMNLMELLNISLMYIIVSYVFAYLGYKTFKKEFEPSIDLDNDGVSIQIVNLIIPIFMGIALLNFIYNIIVLGGGSFSNYMSQVSSADTMLKETGGTTVGYLFGYMAGYLWLYKLLKMNMKISLLFLILVLITILMKASTGRILGTLAYALSYMVIYYFVKIKIESQQNKKYFIILFSLLAIGVFFYFFRLASSIAAIGGMKDDFLSTILEFLSIDLIMYYIADKGNIPNIPILMKIIDAWGGDSTPFLYGESLFTWVYGILPSGLRPEGYQTSVIVKEVWYSHAPGGNLPPTGMGEMFANFWYFGAVFGMYLFGVLAAFFYNLLHKFNNFWYLVMYANIVVGFIMLYPKGEFDNLTLWHIMPIGFTYILILFLTKVAQSSMKSRKD
ncbi:MAG: Unknown protein [uncultured Sulfurovum sp.]|uniref:Oligosaccharide repeat unit polymerase n=1 Tax=uncultured Sulfurovum sp. TaxID=269237 RepID=A0A6S6SJC4_9BACT|nr:MAG: Unknown protein [uncultured Sulfurovum sp.]